MGTWQCILTCIAAAVWINEFYVIQSLSHSHELTLLLPLCCDNWRWHGETYYVILPVAVMLQLSLQWTTVPERLCTLCPRDKWWTSVSMVAAWLLCGSSALWGAVQPWWYEMWLACYRYCCHQRPVWRCCPCSKSQGGWISVNQHAALCGSWC
jgi:hypothetical protein